MTFTSTPTWPAASLFRPTPPPMQDHEIYKCKRKLTVSWSLRDKYIPFPFKSEGYHFINHINIIYVFFFYPTARLYQE